VKNQTKINMEAQKTTKVTNRQNNTEEKEQDLGGSQYLTPNYTTNP
jgi:hypothetical protein